MQEELELPDAVLPEAWLSEFPVGDAADSHHAVVEWAGFHLILWEAADVAAPAQRLSGLLAARAWHRDDQAAQGELHPDRWEAMDVAPVAVPSVSLHLDFAVRASDRASADDCPAVDSCVVRHVR